ncbi:ATP-binding protein [Bifidobacterium callitrichos]|uniref:ATP-binding protein n=1 Tax=Bifidobacterium callitrichos TaxID=762209 RepID=A0A5M9ZBU9_9BIFI|nr:ATP-binding protein [Bifidobacterium callitrichos]KAA8815314.1 ATP-binding protein [Bifidobacterium callitrichos]
MVDKLGRSLMRSLDSWKDGPSRQPLLLRGARQTGKTWLVSEFGREHYRHVLRIDFMRDNDVRGFFSGSLDPHVIVDNLSMYTGIPVNPDDTLIFFDEIQECLRALTALKYFCEDANEYHVIATGSYMGVSKHPDASFPVGKVTMLTLHPLTFLEFLDNAGEAGLARLIAQGRFADVSEVFANRLIARLKEYLFTGGMPAAVLARLNGADGESVRDIQRTILDAYDLDFSKHAPVRLLDRLRLVWQTMPAQLAKENRKFVYGVVRPGARARDFEESLMWLRDYGIVTRVPCVDALRSPLSAYVDVSAFKLFTSDVGLLGALANLSPATIVDGNRLFTEFKGAMTEQYVCQQLVAQGYAPTYWANPKGHAEIDFAIEAEGTVRAIEVKAEQNLHAKSLRYAHDHFGLERALRLSLSGYREEDWLINVPLWAAGGLSTYLSNR